ALEINPNYEAALYNLGLCYALQDKYLAAIGCFEQISKRDNTLYCLSLHEKFYGQLKLCDWKNLSHNTKSIEILAHKIWQRDPQFSLDPFIISSLPLSLEFQTIVNQKRALKHINTLDFKPFTSYKHKNTKIRVGFISPDFKKH